MSNQEIVTQKNDEEISIIDLIAVIIKYRKLIIIGTIVPSIIVAIWLFIVKPILKPEVLPETKTETTANYTLRINYYPQRVYDAIGTVYNSWWDLNSRLLYDFINPTIMGPIYEKNQFADPVAEGEGEKYIKSFIDKKFISCVYYIDVTYLITIKMPISSVDVLTQYIEDFIDYEHNLIQEKWIGDHLELLKERYQIRLNEFEKADPKTVNFEEVQKAKETLQDIELVVKDNKPFYEIEGKPVIDVKTITPEPPAKENKIKSIIIVTFSALLLFIFIAFLINTIQNIKADPESSKKIKDAWISGK